MKIEEFVERWKKAEEKSPDVRTKHIYMKKGIDVYADGFKIRGKRIQLFANGTPTGYIDPEKVVWIDATDIYVLVGQKPVQER